jgi:hypothetical protein
MLISLFYLQTISEQINVFTDCIVCQQGPGSSDGIVTGYGLDGSGIGKKTGGGEIFRTRPD